MTKKKYWFTLIQLTEKLVFRFLKNMKTVG